MDHKHYNPSYSNKMWRGHFQELFDAQNQDCNIQEEFAEKLHFDKGTEYVEDPQDLKVYDPRDIKTPADARAYAKILKPKVVMNNFKDQIQRMDLSGGVPKQTTEQIADVKQHILQHYFRVYGDTLLKTGQKEPDFVRHFKYSKS